MASRDVDQLILKSRKSVEPARGAAAEQVRQLLIEALQDLTDDEIARSSALFASFRGGQVTLIV